MEKYDLEVIQKDKIKIELDPEYFDEKWFENFRAYMYDIYTLKELADHIAFNVVKNGLYFIEGVGTPLRDGNIPSWIDKGYLEHLNKHVNVIYNRFDTDAEVE